MGIRPVELNGMIQRMDDVGMIKKHEDAKPFLDQQNIQMQVNKREDNLAHTVLHPDNTSNLKNDSDAKGESRGTYYKSSGKKKQKKQLKLLNVQRLLRQLKQLKRRQQLKKLL